MAKRALLAWGFLFGSIGAGLMACTTLLGDIEVSDSADSGHAPDTGSDVHPDVMDSSAADTGHDGGTDGHADADANAVSDAATTSCANPDGAETFPGKMFGCPGRVHWSDRNTLCRSGCVACTASRWAATNGIVIPKHHYWTDEDLSYSGVASGQCGAIAADPSATCEPVDPNVGTAVHSPMHVCAPGDSGTDPSRLNIPDPEGNTCVWVDCAYQGNTPGTTDTFFGGCNGSDYSAGTLCCCP